MTALLRSPWWGIYYESLLGTPPSALTGGRLVIAPIQLLLSAAGGLVQCLYTGRLVALLGLSSAGTDQYDTTLLTVQDLASDAIALRGGACAADPRVSGSLTLTRQRLGARRDPAPPLTPENNNIVFTASSTHVYRFRNTGGGAGFGPLGASVLDGVAKGRPVGFTIVGDGCNGATLAVGTWCSVEVAFTSPGVQPRADSLYAVRNAQRLGSGTWVKAL